MKLYMVLLLVVLNTCCLFGQKSYLEDTISVNQSMGFDFTNFSPTELPPSETSEKKVYVRPFITDDARVVGNRLAQMETWLRFDKESGQQWFMFAYGPNKKIELTLGGVYGYAKQADHTNSFSYALPLLQAKFLIKEYAPDKGPGFGFVAGTFIPVGSGAFKPAGYGTFGYLTVSQSFGKGDKVLIHGNLGGNYLHIDGANNTIATWGFGTQIKVYKGLHAVGELFSGDPYVPGTGTAYQVGYRYFFNDLIQIDMTFGKGVAGENPLPLWFSAGVRIVTEKFLHKKKK